jgi:hypothetical protein
MVGVNVTRMVHELCGPKLVGALPQVPPAGAKSLALELVTEIPEMLNVDDSLLRKVKVAALLVVLIATLPKLCAAGVSVTGAIPVPLSGALSEL